MKGDSEQACTAEEEKWEPHEKGLIQPQAHSLANLVVGASKEQFLCLLESILPLQFQLRESLLRSRKGGGRDEEGQEGKEG